MFEFRGRRPRAQEGGRPWGGWVSVRHMHIGQGRLVTQPHFIIMLRAAVWTEGAAIDAIYNINAP